MELCLSYTQLALPEIPGYSAGQDKDTEPAYKSFATLKYDLHTISISHTDCGNEFENNAIDRTLDTFKIDRCLSKKGCPYDNLVEKTTFKTFKVEFVYQHVFENLDKRQLESFIYV